MADQVHNHVASAAAPAATEVRFVAVESDIRGLKSDIGEIKGGIKDLTAAFAGKGTNWSAIGIAVAGFFTLAGWGFALFGNYQSRTNDDITGLKQMISAGIAEQKAAVVAMQADSKQSLATLATAQKAGDDALALKIESSGSKFESSTKEFISRPDLLDKFQTAKEKRDSQQATTDARLDRIEKDLADARKEIVPLGTHQEQWGHQRYINETEAKAIDEIRKKADELFNGRDAIQRLITRIDRVETKVESERK